MNTPKDSRFILAAALGSFLLAGLAGPSLAQDNSLRVPFSLSLGKKTYDQKCAECHGQDGYGSEKGPPLMHKFYEPGHHGNASFYRAMTIGVKQHHWNFGDMKPVPDMNEKQMSKTIEYLRWLQKQNGIIR